MVVLPMSMRRASRLARATSLADAIQLAAAASSGRSSASSSVTSRPRRLRTRGGPGSTSAQAPRIVRTPSARVGKTSDSSAVMVTACGPDRASRSERSLEVRAAGSLQISKPRMRVASDARPEAALSRAAFRWTPPMSQPK